MSKAARRRHAPTIIDVARRAGVSPMTVSRVINRNPNVSSTTRARVEAVVAALKFVPNPAAQSLGGARRLRVGLLYANPSAAYLNELLIGALEAASRCDVQLLLERPEPPSDPANGIDRLMESGVHGLLVPAPLCDAPSVIERLVRTGLPAVAIASGRAAPNGWAITIDDRSAARAMVRHLVSLGHRRIGFIAGNPNQSASAQRLAGYQDGLAEAALPVEQALITPGLFSYRSGLDAADRLLDLRIPPTAIFASNDDMAAAVVATAHRRGLDVPGDLSVCGFDDTEFATAIWPEITTIRQPIGVMARTAIELLRDASRGEADELRIRQSEFTLVRRQSDASPRRRPPAAPE